MRLPRLLFTLAWLTLAACSRPELDAAPASTSAPAQSAPAQSAPRPPLPVSTGAEKYFGDAVLVDQDRTRLRFYSDLMKGKVVVIDSFFTACAGSCPKMADTLSKLQDRLGDRMEKDARFLSISVDTENDTPDKLKEYARRFKAKRGWYFLTGEPGDVAAVLRKIGQFANEPDDHSTIFIIGNEPTGLWKKALGLVEPDKVIEVAMSVVDDRGEDPRAPRPLGIKP